MKKQYFMPEMEVVSLKREDLITASVGCLPDDGEDICVDCKDVVCDCHGVPGQEK